MIDMEGHWSSNNSHICYVEPGETVCADQDTCSMKGMMLPLLFEGSWPVWVRISLYTAGIIYSFLGIFMVADVFMCAIDSITSTTKKVTVSGPNGEQVDENCRMYLSLIFAKYQ